MRKKIKRKNDPFVIIITNALKIWIKSQCINIKELDCIINSSIIDLIKGNITGAWVTAEEINYKGILIESLTLNSGKIKYGLSKIDKRIRFSEPFTINGEIILKDKSISTTLTSKGWSWIGQWLANYAGKKRKFKSLTSTDGRIELATLHSESKEVDNQEILLEAKNGQVLVKSLLTDNKSIFPLDKDIYIEDLMVKGKYIYIKIKSLVKS